MIRNEAAERLRRVGYLDHTYVQDEDDPACGEPLAPLLDEALATERRLTVEDMPDPELMGLYSIVIHQLQIRGIADFPPLILDDLATADVDEERQA